MANKNFVVHNGLTVGALTIDADTGDLVTSGNITLSGGGSIAVSNVAVSSISQNDSSISISDTGTGSNIRIIIDGVTEHTVDAAGLNLASGDRYAINGTSVLNATDLGSGVINITGNVSGLTSYGTIRTTANIRATTGNLVALDVSTINGLTIAGAPAATTADATALAIALGG
jgi:hypothetical protein